LSGSTVPLIGPGGAFSYVSDGIYTANDGTISSINGRLVMDSSTYTLSSIGLIDGAKLLLVGNQDFIVPNHREISVQGVFQNRNLNIVPNPFGVQVLDAPSDPRLAAFTFSVIYKPTQMIFGFVMTNTRLYAGSTKNDPINASLYVNLIPVLDLTPNQIVALSIKINKKKGYIRFMVDGIEVFRMNKSMIGTTYPSQYVVQQSVGQVNEMFFPSTFSLYMGNVNYMSAYSPCNVFAPTWDGGRTCIFPPIEQGLVGLIPPTPVLDPHTGNPPLYVIPVPVIGSTLFGQGNVATMRNITVALCSTPKC